MLLFFVACAVARADDLSAPSIVKTIRYHPTGAPARVGMTLLSRVGGEALLHGAMAESALIWAAR